MISFALIAQVMIGLLGAAAVALLASKNAKRRWCGFIVGFVSEPFWVYAALTADPVQWGVFALALWWAYFYYRGAVNNWPLGTSLN